MRFVWRAIRPALACAAAGFAATAAFAAQLVTLPVPAVTIYPGAIIEADNLTERTFVQREVGTRNADSIGMLVGKVAKRTLLPQHPIPTMAIDDVDLVKRGTSVQLVFQQSGLLIVAYAAPLEDGSPGDVIRVRNIDSGAVVIGTVQTDGSVRVGAQ